MRSMMSVALISSVLFLVNTAGSTTIDDIDWKLTEFSGPGLAPNLQLPEHYFYIKPFSKDGQPLKSSIIDSHTHKPIVPADFIQVTATSQNYHPLKFKISSRGDGTYIARLTLYRHYPSLKIQITAGNAGFSKTIELSNASGLNCDCPAPSIEKWMSDHDCDRYLTHHKAQLDYDFNKFPDGIDLDLAQQNFKKMKSGPGNGYSVCKYVVKNNEIWRECAGKHVGFKMFSDEYLSSLTRSMRLPDLEFMQNLGDWPLSDKRRGKYPLVSWCGSDDSHDVILPTYDMTRATLQSRNPLFINEESNDNIPNFTDKIDKGIFRGRDSRQERLDLAKMANQNPDELDVGITAFFFFPKDEALAATRIPQSTFADYKYIISVDGTVAAYRMPALLAMSSLIFKQKSKYFEHFYRALSDDSDFVTLRHDLSDTVEKIKEWREKPVEEIDERIRKTRAKAQLLLEPASIMCYHAEFFRRWASLQSRPVKRMKSMEFVSSHKNGWQEKICDGVACGKAKYDSSFARKHEIALGADARKRDEL